MNARTIEQIAAIRETRWQLEAALNLTVGLEWDERYSGGWTEAREAAVIQAAAYLLAHNYQGQLPIKKRQKNANAVWQDGVR